ncbi:hypothetical protein ACLOJK_022288 [Asimina triloba]
MESEAIDECIAKNKSPSLSLLVSKNRKGLEEKSLFAEMTIIEREEECQEGEKKERKKKREMGYLSYNNGDHQPTVGEIGNGVGVVNRENRKSKMK